VKASARTLRLLYLLTPEDVFRLHPKIRWALSRESGGLVFSKLRPGISRYGKDEDDRKFMEFGPQFLIGIAGGLSPSNGTEQIHSLIINLEKYSALITRVQDGYLAISVDRSDALRVFEEVEPNIRKL